MLRAWWPFAVGLRTLSGRLLDETLAILNVRFLASELCDNGDTRWYQGQL